MGGSSDSKKKKNKSEEPTNIPMTTVQPFMPGLDSMIAQQLGMGGFGDPSSLLSYMNSIHTPMQVPANSLPPPPSGNSGRGGGGGRGRLGGIMEQFMSEDPGAFRRR